MTLPMTEKMQQEIIARSAALIARASAPQALLSASDIAALTSFAYRGSVMQDMLSAKDFPRPVMVGTREKRWVSRDVFHWLSKRKL